MARAFSYLNPLPGFIPACLSLALIYDLLRSLPRPSAGGPANYGQQMIQDVLAAVDLLGPRDRLEAALAVQMVVLQRQAREASAMATAEPDFDKRMRLQRHQMALLRRYEGLGRELRGHRRALEAQGLEHISPRAEYDLAALEIVWRDPTAELPDTAVVPERVEMPLPAVKSAEQAEAEKAQAIAELETLQLAEAARLASPKRAFAGVPLWKQHGRRYLEELTEEELNEVIEAQGRDETIEEPPQAPEGVAVQGPPEVRLTQAEVDALTPEQRWRRYGSRLEPGAFGVRPAGDAGARA